MKLINMMNFVRQCEPRSAERETYLFKATKETIDLVKEFQIPNTFLLQYDAVIDPNYMQLFKENLDENMELGLWYEIVQPLTEKAGLPWRSETGWKWDWHIVPGFSMAYTPRERELLIDEAMHKFREVFGFFPKTIGSWLIDTHTIHYLEQHYEIDAVCICRDQSNTDAYTLLGGYFNQAYYPSKKNMFTPAQTEEYRINIPVFRLLGPDPIHNYDKKKYLSDTGKYAHTGCYTLEATGKTGSTPEIVDWFFKTYFENEDLGFSYAQLGQENSFGYENYVPALRMQLQKLQKLPDIQIMKMCDSGKWFKQTYPKKTPATSVCALDDWNTGNDIQSVYYDCENYTANLFRYKNSIFFRELYLFDEKTAEDYLTEPCTTWDATYENLPLVDTLTLEKEKTPCGIVLDEATDKPYTAEKIADGTLAIKWRDKSVIFDENSIRIENSAAVFHKGNMEANIAVRGNCAEYQYKNKQYALYAETGELSETPDGYKISPENGLIILKFKRM